MAAQTQPLDKLQSYVNKVKRAGYEPVTPQSKAAYEARLNKTLLELQDLVRQQQSVIEQVSPNLPTLLFITWILTRTQVESKQSGQRV